MVSEKSPQDTHSQPGLDTALVLDSSSIIDFASNRYGNKKTDWINLCKYLVDTGAVQEVVIPDQIIFELTGLLPESQRDAQKRVPQDIHTDSRYKASTAVHNALKPFIDNSPRLSDVRHFQPERKLRNQNLLAYTLLHDRENGKAVMSHTKICSKFSHRTQAELDMACGVPGDYSRDYRISLEDALEVAGECMDVGQLRLRLVGAHNLGWIPSDKLKERTKNGERYLTNDWVIKELRLEESHPFVQRARKQSSAGYAHLKDLLDTKIIGKQELTDVGRTWKLCLADAFVTGLLPMDDIVSIAEKLDFKVPNTRSWTYKQLKDSGMMADDWKDRLATWAHEHKPDDPEFAGRFKMEFSRNGIDEVTLGKMGLFGPGKAWEYFKGRLNNPGSLFEQGFFEHSLSIADANNIASLETPSHPYHAMKLLCDAPLIAAKRKVDFEDACRDYLPYEKIFSEAVVNGAISLHQMLSLAVKAGGMTQKGNHYTTANGEVMCYYNDKNPERSVMAVKRGFMKHRKFGVKDGQTQTSLQVVGKKLDLNAHGIERDDNFQYMTFDTLQGLSSHSQHHYTLPQHLRYHRMFDVMLWPKTRENASTVREAAMEVLGQTKLHQIELDFSNKHFRYLVKRLQNPPYVTAFTTAHATSRGDQWDLGEMAILEHITGRPNKKWLVVNHDNELRDSIENCQLPPKLVRKKTDYHRGAMNINGRLQNDETPRPTTLRTDEFMEQVAMAILNDPRSQTREGMRELENAYPAVGEVLRNERLMEAADARLRTRETGLIEGRNFETLGWANNRASTQASSSPASIARSGGNGNYRDATRASRDRH